MNKKKALPTHDKCTGCGVCGEICPTKSISFSLDDLDCKYPAINFDLCIECDACVRGCHVCVDREFNYPKTAYASWNLSKKERTTSASGGIATAMYTYALKHSISTYGVQYEVHKGAKYIALHNYEDVVACKNSKYVHSECIGVFSEIKEHLKNEEHVIFIGLPCHVSALKSYLVKSYDKLLTVDIICHGVAPHEYLEKHILSVERKKKRKVSELSFRDPSCGTEKFYMTMKDNKGCFYKAAPQSADAYQAGYHSALIYRENCYNCQYAKAERIADITIGDFSGLGKFAPWEGSKVGVSCVLISTEKGQRFIDQLVEEAVIYCEERPIEEALKVEKQLIHPSIPHKKREEFKQAYKRNQNFEKAAIRALRGDIARFRMHSIRHRLRLFISAIMPIKAKRVYKKLFKRKVR